MLLSELKSLRTPDLEYYYNTHKICALTTPEVLKVWGTPRRAPLVLWGGRVHCMRDVFILIEMWVQYETYFDKTLCLVSFTYHIYGTGSEK
jgi:hypothetical protein